MAQSINLADSTEETYYIGINPVAVFTGIREDGLTRYLPVLGNLETGLAIFGGKCWKKHYNLETRFSFGSPVRGYNLMLVQSGFNYRFHADNKHFHPYAGIFIKLYSLENRETGINDASIIALACTGARFISKRYFLDLRVSEHICAVNWSDRLQSKANTGFLPSIYTWSSPYVPFAAIGIGYLFR
ncbi:MAG TPA: hypothetical protein VLD19_19965 [Chitinophagaceae bacterium]|nr:hypothetical protein [Chitinophagaceae bacterium]